MGDAYTWVTTASHWSGSTGIWQRLAEHLRYSAIALVIAVVIAVPVGLVIGHTGKGNGLLVGATGAVRAIPTLGLLILLNKLKPLALWPVEVALVALAIPPILANTAAGVAAVDAAARDAAAGIGMSARQTLWRVEIPLALPLIVTGIRSASLQVVATATVAAYTGLGGLGRLVLDGYDTQDLGQAYGGSLLVVALALAIEGLYALVQRLLSRSREGVRADRLSNTPPTEVPAILSQLSNHPLEES
ncbi:MAG: transporter permease [Acidimicrobiia bacterium]|nr:transporter permease [Acidimicrobiia bacterium]